MHVTHTPSIVSFEDSTGHVVQEVATVQADADTFAHAPGAVHVRGIWDGSSLELTREGPGGAKVVETWSLGDGGRALVSVVHIEASEERPARVVRRVYTRVDQP